MKKKIPVSIIPLLFCAISVWAFGPNSPQYLEGPVEKVRKDRIVISKHSVPEDKGEQLTFEITDRTKYKEFTSLKELSKGDIINVEYVRIDGKNIASELILLEPDKNIKGASRKDILPDGGRKFKIAFLETIRHD